MAAKDNLEVRQEANYVLSSTTSEKGTQNQNTKKELPMSSWVVKCIRITLVSNGKSIYLTTRRTMCSDYQGMLSQ
jgi:hypothetical protein